MIGEFLWVSVREDELVVEVSLGHAEGDDGDVRIRSQDEHAVIVFYFFFRHRPESRGSHSAAQGQLIIVDIRGEIGLDQGIAAVPGLVGHGFVVDAAFQSVDGLAPLRIIEDNWLYFWLMFRQRQAEDGGRAQHEKGYSKYREKRSRHLRWRETIRSHAHHTNGYI